MKRVSGYFLLEVVVAMAILSLVVTSLMNSLQSAQANIQQVRLKQTALLRCERALEEIRWAWSFDQALLTTDGTFCVLPSVAGTPDVGYRARPHEAGGAPGAWFPSLTWTPSGSPPAATGLLFVEVRSFTDISPDINPDRYFIATLTALFAREF